MNSVRANNLSLKYQRFTSSDCKDIGIRHLEFVKKKLSSFAIIYEQLKMINLHTENKDMIRSL